MDNILHRNFDSVALSRREAHLKKDLVRARRRLLSAGVPRTCLKRPNGDSHPRLRQQTSARDATVATASHNSRHPTTATAAPTCVPPAQLGAEVKQQQVPQAQGPLGAAHRRAGGGPGGNSGPGPDPDDQPTGPGGPGPGGPNGGLPFRLRYWIMLLAEYGGMYGTAAVIIAALTHVDAFGGLHWEPSSVALGLGFMAPALVWDAVVGLPDWRTREEDAAALVRLFVDPELLQQHSATRRQQREQQAQQQQGRGQQQQQQEQEEQGRQQVRPYASAAGDDALGAASASSAATAAAADGPQSGLTTTTTTTTVEAVAASAATGAGSDAACAGDLGGTSTSHTNIDSGNRPGATRGTDASMQGLLLRTASASTEATRGQASSSSGSGSSNELSSASSSSASSSSVAGTGAEGGEQQPGTLWAAAQRLRMALELMQESSIRNNPGARLAPVQEVAVILVAVLADEMLYRAVLLTLFGRWLRDRFYEAGAEDTLSLSLGWLPSSGPVGLGAGPPVWELGTAEAAQWVALGVGAALGAAVFGAKAWQEATVAQRLRAIQLAEREEAAKALRKQRLLGQHVTEEELQEELAKQARLEAAQASLVASIGMQGALVWVLEGSREVYQVAASGASFILTGNLAAPLAGSLAAQLLVSLYQRIGLQRSLQYRAQVVARRRAALQRRQQEEQQGQRQPGDQQPPQHGSAVAAATRPASPGGAESEGGAAAVGEGASVGQEEGCAPKQEGQQRQEGQDLQGL